MYPDVSLVAQFDGRATLVRVSAEVLADDDPRQTGDITVIGAYHPDALADLLEVVAKELRACRGGALILAGGEPVAVCVAVPVVAEARQLLGPPGGVQLFAPPFRKPGPQCVIRMQCRRDARIRKRVHW